MAGFLRVFWEDAACVLARIALQLVLLADQAYKAAGAVLVTLARVLITRRGLLEWETAAASDARGAAARVAPPFDPSLSRWRRARRSAGAGAALVAISGRPPCPRPRRYSSCGPRRR